MSIVNKNKMIFICMVLIMSGTIFFNINFSRAEETFNEFKSELPVVYITTDNSAITDYPITVDIKIKGNDRFGDQYNGKSTIKLRGNTSKFYSQKPYKLKLDKKTNLFNMGKNKHWVLIPNYLDLAGVRNKLGSDFARQFGVENADMQWVEVVLDGKYVGFYMLSEHVRIGENRVDIYDWEQRAEDVAGAIYERNKSSLKPEDKDRLEKKLTQNLNWISTNYVIYDDVEYKISDYYIVNKNITGGYLLELSSENDEKSKLIYDKNAQIAQYKSGPVMVSKPEYLYTNQEMTEYISNYYRDFEDALISINGYNTKGKHYSEYVDISTFCGLWLTNELLGNYDAFSKSRYAYKNIDEKIKFGPAWDFDYGIMSAANLINEQELKKANGPIISNGPLWSDAVDDPYFIIKSAELFYKNLDWIKKELAYDEANKNSTYKYICNAGNRSNLEYLNVNGWIAAAKLNYDKDFDNVYTYLNSRVNLFEKWFVTPASAVESFKITEEKYGACKSTNPYEKDEKSITVKFENAKKDESKVFPSDAVADVGSDLQLTLEIDNDRLDKVRSYVNGIYNAEYDLTKEASLVEGSKKTLNISIPGNLLNEPSGKINVINFIGEGSENYVQNFVTVKCIDDASRSTQAPTKALTQEPTLAPTKAPTQAPTLSPTKAPTQATTLLPTKAPTQNALKAFDTKKNNKKNTAKKYLYCYNSKWKKIKKIKPNKCTKLYIKTNISKKIKLKFGKRVKKIYRVKLKRKNNKNGYIFVLTINNTSKKNLKSNIWIVCKNKKMKIKMY